MALLSANRIRAQKTYPKWIPWVPCRRDNWRRPRPVSTKAYWYGERRIRSDSASRTVSDNWLDRLSFGQSESFGHLSQHAPLPLVVRFRFQRHYESVSLNFQDNLVDTLPIDQTYHFGCLDLHAPIRTVVLLGKRSKNSKVGQSESSKHIYRDDPIRQFRLFPTLSRTPSISASRTLSETD